MDKKGIPKKASNNCDGYFWVSGVEVRWGVCKAMFLVFFTVANNCILSVVQGNGVTVSNVVNYRVGQYNVVHYSVEQYSVKHYSVLQYNVYHYSVVQYNGKYISLVQYNEVQ